MRHEYYSSVNFIPRGINTSSEFKKACANMYYSLVDLTHVIDMFSV